MHREHLVDQRSDVEGLRIDREAVLVDARHVQEVAHQPVHLVRRTADAGSRAVPLGLGWGELEEIAGDADVVQRAAEIVGDHREHVVPRSVRLLHRAIEPGVVDQHRRPGRHLARQGEVGGSVASAGVLGGHDRQRAQRPVSGAERDDDARAGREATQQAQVLRPLGHGLELLGEDLRGQHRRAGTDHRADPVGIGQLDRVEVNQVVQQRLLLGVGVLRRHPADHLALEAVGDAIVGDGRDGEADQAVDGVVGLEGRCDRVAQLAEDAQPALGG